MLTYTQKLPPLPLTLRNHTTMTATFFGQKLDLQKLLRPETPLEAMLLETPEFQEGMHWGKPRFGHPEGKVGLHVKEVLDNVERMAPDATYRYQLRLLALIHDTFKYREVKTFAEGKRIHHGKLAREFVTPYLEDDPLLNIIELHDEAFYIWRQLELKDDAKSAIPRFHLLLEQLGDYLPLYFLFFKCDTLTGDKILAPLFWFEDTLKELGNKQLNALIESFPVR